MKTRALRATSCLSLLLWLLVSVGLFANARNNQSPELVESRELSSKVIKLYNEAKFDEALPLAKRALGLSEKALGSAHEDLIPFLTNLAELYKAKRQPGHARSHLERALTIAEKTFAENDIRTAVLLDRLGYVAYEQREQKDAENFFLRSLQIKEKALGPENPDVTQTAFSLAEIYRLRGDYQKAEPLYERVVRIREKTPDKNNSDLISALEGYVSTLLALKETKQADEAQQRVNKLLADQGIVHGGVLNGKALKLAQPPYPGMARAERASGIVRVQVIIDENGKVISAKAVNPGSIHPALIAAAEHAARQSLFTPTYLSGVRVKVSGIIIYNFVAY